MIAFTFNLKKRRVARIDENKMKPDTPISPIRGPRYCLWASLVLWYFWCVSLPLVGRAGSRTAFARANQLTVTAILLASLLLALAALRQSLHQNRGGRWQKRGLGLWAGFLGVSVILLLFGAFGA